MTSPIWRKAGAELIGTYGLVTAGCGAIIMNAQGHLPGIGVALAFGLIISLMVAATGHISGGHLNPAVSVGLATTGHLPWKDLPYYLIAQFVGAIVGAATLWFFFGQAILIKTVNMPAAHVTPMQAGLMEALLTAFLVFVISAVATDPRGIGRYVAPFAIGGTILVDALWGGPISGASMNPARSFGPALLAGHIDWANLAIYIIGPIIGGIVGAVLYHLIRQPAAAVQEESVVVATAPRAKVSNSNNKQKVRARR